MSAQRHGGRQSVKGITAIGVEGFKSIASRQRIDIRPLTLVAGVNSSGKSSMLQPLLLLKQTLQSDYDPGALLLDGPNVRFTRAEQVLSRAGRRRASFSVRLELDTPLAVDATYRRGRDGTAFVVESTTLSDDQGSITVRAGMTSSDVRAALGRRLDRVRIRDLLGEDAVLTCARFSRSFLVPAIGEGTGGDSVQVAFPLRFRPVEVATQELREIIHVPAWRGARQRAYPVTAIDRAFPGTFDRYVASVIAGWRAQGDQRHRQAEEDLAALGLTSELTVNPVDQTQLEVLVGRLPGSHARQEDLVNIADVGFGVSQCLPVIVAMLAASPGQLVTIEEPEIHLHPRAQVTLARLAVRAARRGVRVVLETHSSLLLRGVQTAVAKKEIAPDEVALHWFERSPAGATSVRTAEVAHDGSFGEWPVDFDEVALAADRDYLDAS